jgi:hypothetical protein
MIHGNDDRINSIYNPANLERRATVPNRFLSSTVLKGAFLSKEVASFLNTVAMDSPWLSAA